MAKIFDSVIANIDSGKMGLNQGLNTGLERLKDYMPNVQRGNMYLIGGETGSGKSALAVDSFLYSPYDDWLLNYRTRINFHAFVWSMEMDKDIVLTKAICRRIFMITEGKVLVDINYVLSRGKNRVSQEIYNLVLNTRQYFEDFEDKVTILNNENPTGIRNTIHDYMLANGKDTYKQFIIKDRVTGEEIKREVYDRYVPHNDIEKMYTICIFDHVGLTKGERNFTKKQTIDKLTEYMIDYRDRYQITPVFVQQLNRSLSSAERFKQDRVLPQISDFKESSDTTDASNFVLSLFSPNRYEMKKFRDYTIDWEEGGLGDRFKYLSLLKCRDGNADIGIGLAFIGEIGKFQELKKAKLMLKENYDYFRSFTKVINTNTSIN